jgi:hypothetical protein
MNEAKLIAEVTVLTEMVRVLSDRIAQMDTKQEQGEPVAWMDIDEKGAASGLRYWSEPDNRHEVALYTTTQQRTWVGLTDEQTTEVIDSMPQGINGWMSDWDLYEYANAVKAKLEEKNT